MRTIMLAALVTIGVGIRAPSLGHADDKGKCELELNADGTIKVKSHMEGKTIVIDTKIEVCGHVPRPSVVYVLQPKTINYEWENLKQDFLPLILATVKKAPF